MPPDTANAVGNWQSYLDTIIRGGLDYAKLKLIDVERAGDDKNVPDAADLYYGLDRPVGSMTAGGMLLLAAVIFVGGFALYRLVK